jgi:hypothetical protein
MATCTEVFKHVTRYAPPVEFEEVPCFRELDENGRHKGQHQGWTVQHRLATWDTSGSSVSRLHEDWNAYTNCTICGLLHAGHGPVGTEFVGSPDSFHPGEPIQGACFHCRLWARRAIRHQQGWVTERVRRSRPKVSRTVRFHDDDAQPSLLTWLDGSSGAFGDRKFHVRWDNGDERGPASSLWHSGFLDWWVIDQFPPNAIRLGREAQPLSL